MSKYSIEELRDLRDWLDLQIAHGQWGGDIHHVLMNKAKLKQIRDSLQPTVTRGEIAKFAKQVFMGGPLASLEIKLENIFKSKGLRVEAK